MKGQQRLFTASRKLTHRCDYICVSTYAISSCLQELQASQPAKRQKTADPGRGRGRGRDILPKGQQRLFTASRKPQTAAAAQPAPQPAQVCFML